MLTYNTQLKQIKLPEYGRVIQSMVDYCKTIEDRDERTRCARAIVKTMYTLFPSERNEAEGNRKFWDHLAIISNFQLDIDWPIDVIKPEEIAPRPDPVYLDDQPTNYRHYGKNIERMIYLAADMEENEDRWALVTLIASQMKKMMLAVNKDGASDEKIFRDLEEISGGRIRINPVDMPLHEFKAAPTPSKKKKKK